MRMEGASVSQCLGHGAIRTLVASTGLFSLLPVLECRKVVVARRGEAPRHECLHETDAGCSIVNARGWRSVGEAAWLHVLSAD